MLLSELKAVINEYIKENIGEEIERQSDFVAAEDDTSLSKKVTCSHEIITVTSDLHGNITTKSRKRKAKPEDDMMLEGQLTFSDIFPDPVERNETPDENRVSYKSKRFFEEGDEVKNIYVDGLTFVIMEIKEGTCKCMQNSKNHDIFVMCASDLEPVEHSGIL